jgi:hypothetical protein
MRATRVALSAHQNVFPKALASGPAAWTRTVGDREWRSIRMTDIQSTQRGGTTRPVTASAATVIVWFHLRSPELSAEFERMMAGDRDVDLGSFDTVSDWRLTRPVNVPGQPSEPADYVLIAEITEVDRWELEASEQLQRLADDVAHLVSDRRMLVVERVL